MELAQSKVWIVEDEAELAEAFHDFLERDCQVSIFKSADEALKELEKGAKVDLIVSDIKMPGTDGLDFTHKAKLQLHDTPIILISAYAQKYHAIRAISEGVFGFLEKPFDPARLRLLIRQGLIHRQIAQLGLTISNRAADLAQLVGEALQKKSVIATDQEQEKKIEGLLSEIKKLQSELAQMHSKLASESLEKLPAA